MPLRSPTRGAPWIGTDGPGVLFDVEDVGRDRARRRSALPGTSRSDHEGFGRHEPAMTTLSIVSCQYKHDNSVMSLSSDSSSNKGHIADRVGRVDPDQDDRKSLAGPVVEELADSGSKRHDRPPGSYGFGSWSFPDHGRCVSETAKASASLWPVTTWIPVLCPQAREHRDGIGTTLRIATDSTGRLAGSCSSHVRRDRGRVGADHQADSAPVVARADRRLIRTVCPAHAWEGLGTATCCQREVRRRS